MYDADCNSIKHCNLDCQKTEHSKLFVIGTDGGVVQVKRLLTNARIPVRGTLEAAGYDLAATQAAVYPVHGKVLLKTGISIAMPPGCYGRIAPRSGLTLNKIYKCRCKGDCEVVGFRQTVTSSCGYHV